MLCATFAMRRELQRYTGCQTSSHRMLHHCFKVRASGSLCKSSECIPRRNLTARPYALHDSASRFSVADWSSSGSLDKLKGLRKVFLNMCLSVRAGVSWPIRNHSSALPKWSRLELWFSHRSASSCSELLMRQRLCAYLTSMQMSI